MKSRFLFGSALLTCAMTAAVGAQSQSTPSTSPAGRTATDNDRDRITVSGCLQAMGAATIGTSGSGPGATAGTAGSTRSANTGTTATTGTAQRFMLVNAFEGSTPGGGSAVTSPTPPGSGTNESAARAGATQPQPTGLDNANKMYLLRGDLPDLGQHVGEQVQISGRRVASTTPSTGAAGAGSGATGNDRVQPSRNDRPTMSNGASTQGAEEIEVTSLRMIASVCPTR